MSIPFIRCTSVTCYTYFGLCRSSLTIILYDGQGSHFDNCTFLCSQRYSKYATQTDIRGTCTKFYVGKVFNFSFAVTFHKLHFSIFNNFPTLKNVDNGGFGGSATTFSGCLTPQGKSPPLWSGWLLFWLGSGLCFVCFVLWLLLLHHQPIHPGAEFNEQSLACCSAADS